jgi:hypothetical protein
MAIVLVLVALAMIAGGAAAIVQGVPIMVLERGWTLVIAGAVVAGSGAILAGIGFSLSALRRIEGELGRLRERVGRLDAAVPVPPPPSGLTASREGPAGPTPPFPGLGAEPRPVPSARRTTVVSAAEPDRAAQASELALDPVANGRLGQPAAARAPNGAEPPSAGPAKTATQTPTVVGTYTSGGNSYAMFSDGSIEAETPNGQFRFQSLDELKAFIASGGEEGTAPAPT